MAVMTSLPAARAAFIDQSGRPTPQFYRFLETLATAQAGNVSPDEITAINAQLAELQAEIAALPSAAIPKLQVEFPILSQGLLQNGFAKLVLDKPGDSGAGALKGITLDAWGRVTGTTDGTITGTAGRVTVTDGDAAAGVPTIDLAPVANTGGGSLLKIVRDAWGRITGTSTPVIADLKSAGLVVPQGYIDGLQMVWNSATSISVTSGAAYIPSLGNVLASNSALTLSGLSLAASTWYHVYLYSNAGTPAIECVTTAPSGPYNGAARTKSGDTTRRYVGSVRTDASGNAMNFLHLDKSVIYADGWQVLGSGKAATSTPVACAGFIPVTGLSGKFKVQLNVSGGSGNPALYVCQGGITPNPATTALVAACPAISGALNFGITFGDCAVDGSQTVNYILSPASVGTGGAYLSVLGYDFGR